MSRFLTLKRAFGKGLLVNFIIFIFCIVNFYINNHEILTTGGKIIAFENNL